MYQPPSTTVEDWTMYYLRKGWAYIRYGFYLKLRYLTLEAAFHAETAFQRADIALTKAELDLTIITMEGNNV